MHACKQSGKLTSCIFVFWTFRPLQGYAYMFSHCSLFLPMHSGLAGPRTFPHPIFTTGVYQAAEKVAGAQIFVE